MKSRIATLFSYSVGIILLLTSAAKLISSFGQARILQMSDPILEIPFRYVFIGVGAVELAVALHCLFGAGVALKAGLVAWLATSFVFYRLGLWWVGYQMPCSCMGNLTDLLNISPEVANSAMKVILAYLFIGSYTTLFWFWRQRRRISHPTLTTGTTP